MSTPRPTAIDLFAGAGGFSIAAKQAGFQLLAAVEYDKWAQVTYRQNIVKKSRPQPQLYGDILELDPNDLMQKAGLKSGELDLLIGGPPCQGFSTHRIKDAGVKDPRNKLLLRYFDFVKTLRPKTFVVENVSGMLWKRHAKYVKQFKDLACANGYAIVADDPVPINARDFGVPQNRKRVFILGVRSDIQVPENFVWPPPATHHAPNSPEVEEHGLPEWIRASTVFELPLKPAEEDPNNIHMQPGPAMLKRFKKTKLNGGGREGWKKDALACHKEHDGHKDVYGRIDPSKPGPTMTTGCINPSRGRFVHPTEHHGITARHAARFQTFPEDFIFYGGLGHAGKQIGNAVPVVLGTHILQLLAREIL